MKGGSSDEMPNLEKYEPGLRQKFDEIIQATTPELPENVAYAKDLLKKLTGNEPYLFSQYKEDVAKIEAKQRQLRRQGYFIDSNPPSTPQKKEPTPERPPKRKGPGCTIS
ncbi:hypothetical protein [Candidatus Berkiella aquae]|uniref:Uncharacterized protein n=1 Tax=Candidatus Berkiella aquae TaxID=295108 RepID=A0A0Q9YNT4_9GAMM|nr:hypothetical protein [Candidatus Berkiella aquae]MCS5712165.1 hypothetical protein [Candidatus Berkiella aquae]